MDDWFPTFRRIFDSGPTFRFFWPRRATLPQRLALLRLIAVATEERLPLSPLLDAWAIDQGGAQGQRIHRLSLLLKAGAPLPDAIEQVPRALGDEDVLAIRFGAQTGILAASVRQTIDDLSQRLESPRPTFRGVLIYGAIVSFIFLLISVFIYIKIMPAIVSIVKDFNMKQPPALQESIRFADMVSQFWWIGALALLALVWSAFSATPGRFLRDKVFGRLFGAVRELRSADVLEKLSLAAKAGRPMPAALSTLARYHFDPTIRHKLLFARNEMEQGADVWPTMAASGLLTPPEERLLTIADRLGNRSWALDQLARGKQRRTRRWLARLSNMLLPAVVLLLGSFVLFQGLSLFVPLTELVSSQL